MKQLFVRVQPKSGQATFFRCGMKFGKAWQRAEVDAATAKRLEEEQMLEVAEDQPADFEDQTSGAADPAGGEPLSAAAPKEIPLGDASGTPAAAPAKAAAAKPKAGK